MAANPMCMAAELKEKLARGDDFLLLDVRTPQEWEVARIDAAKLIPMDEVRSSMDLLEEHLDREIVVMCHHGVRSASVQGYLTSQGFANVRNLVGGIERYSLEADPRIPRY